MAKWKSRYSGTQSTNQALSKSATRGTAMLLTVSFTFIILTGPLAIANAVWANYDMPSWVFNILVTFLYMNPGINAVLYCVSGSRFRNELLKLISCSRNDSNIRRVQRTVTVSTLDNPEEQISENDNDHK